jgi:hypothetical protein
MYSSYPIVSIFKFICLIINSTYDIRLDLHIKNFSKAQVKNLGSTLNLTIQVLVLY